MWFIHAECKLELARLYETTASILRMDFAVSLAESSTGTHVLYGLLTPGENG